MLEKIFSYTHFTSIILYNIHDQCANVNILKYEKVMSTFKI